MRGNQLVSKTLNICVVLAVIWLCATGSRAQSFVDISIAFGFNVDGENRGIAIGDFNNDGLEDIYVSRLSGVNLLYRNAGDFTFEEVSADYGVRDTSKTTCSIWFDLENDGDLDLFLANVFQSNVLYRNDGETFVDVSAEYGVQTVSNPKSIHTVDYDNDGDMDIYLAQVLDQNILWRNDDGTGFTDVTESAGIDDTGRSLGAIFFDYDNDGDQDLYQTRDGDDPNLFWINNGDGSFIESSAAVGLDYVGLGMGCDIADLNRDGFADIYLTNLYENKLYLSSPSGVFNEFSGPAGVDDIGMGWSTIFFDCNNDGLDDIYLANDSYFGVNGETDIRNRLFINTGNLQFASGDYTSNEQNIFGTYGAACADFDLDGLPDLALANSGPDDGNQIFDNRSAGGNFIAFRLEGDESNFFGIGSRVELYYGDEVVMKQVYAGSGYASQSSSRLHFGLGEHEAVDSLVIYWPSGIRQTFTGPVINLLHAVKENRFGGGFGGAVVWTEPAIPTQFDDVTVYFNAAEGNGALAGFTGNVFAHTGVITDDSANGNDWRHVIGNWGTFDSRVLMNSLGNDIYSLSYNIEEFYDIPPGEQVNQLAFVFRNVDGSIVGRAFDGADIFTDVLTDSSSLFVSWNSPADRQIVPEEDSILFQIQTSRPANITISDNDEIIFTDSTDQVDFFYTTMLPGIHTINVSAILGIDTINQERQFYLLARDHPIEDSPADIRDGLNYTDSSYIFQLHAPGKAYGFLFCPDNGFTPDPDFRMTLTSDSMKYWIELPHDVFNNRRNVYQYFVDDRIGVPDPYSEVILDPWNDPFLAPEILAEWPDYPEEAQFAVTVFDTIKEVFPWVVTDFVKPEKTNLVIYELLVRDFLADHSYTSLMDTLDYLERLGVNAIELMPIQEFEGNISWGYNPSLHMAVDKYYGSREQLKAFIDACHQRGIAVIQDVVFNHAFSQSPLAQLYWDNTNFRPFPDNPWLNVTAKHPFNVGYDFNHESDATKYWVKRILEYWIEEFKFDGFRFDLSKGFTQRNSGNDVGAWGNYDASRIAILKDYADYIWSLDSTNYVILEHFAVNQEERELANYGMMIWGNTTHEFAEAAMGYRSDLEGADYTFKDWNDPHLVAYMESHDEERMVYKITNFGDSEDGYNTRFLPTALERVAAAAAIFYSIPGPKMLWQFGEYGYDFPINYCPNGSIHPDCRVDPKPIRWDYLEDANRNKLRDITAAIIHLRTTYPTFATGDFIFNDGNFFLKTVHLNHPEMDAVTLANFRVTDSDINPKFQNEGWWYEYFSGDSIFVEDTQERITFGPGEYRIYTSVRITPPDGFFTSTFEVPEVSEIHIMPNPVNPGHDILIPWDAVNRIDALRLIGIPGLQIEITPRIGDGHLQFRIPDYLSSGVYVVDIISDNVLYVGKVVVLE